MPDENVSGRTVGQIGEDPLVADVTSRYPGAGWLTVGPGDDAAVLDLADRFPGPLVVSTDTLVEGQDFRRDWSTAFDVGVKTAAQNFADIAAMGAHPHTLLISLTAPADLPVSWARGLTDGLIAECARAGAVVAGGDLSSGAELSVTGTALGTLSAGPAVLRSGARPGDIVAIAGVSGRSAAGWALLLAGHGVLAGPASDAGPASGGNPASAGAPVSVDGSALVVESALPDGLAGLVEDHRRPRPPYPAGPEAARAGATAMIDTSDGLVRDAERVARASGVVLDLDPDALQPDADLLAAASFLGEPDPQGWVLSGGEDHALLACFGPDTTLPPAFRRIGRVLAGSPAVLLAGEPIKGPGGWRHFA